VLCVLISPLTNTTHEKLLFVLDHIIIVNCCDEAVDQAIRISLGHRRNDFEWTATRSIMRSTCEMLKS
jgi:hypothetical protein